VHASYQPRHLDWLVGCRHGQGKSQEDSRLGRDPAVSARGAAASARATNASVAPGTRGGYSNNCPVESLPFVGIDRTFSFPLAYFKRHDLPLDWPSFLNEFQSHGPTDEVQARQSSSAESRSITQARSSEVGVPFSQKSACEYILPALRALRSARPRMIRAPVLAQPRQ
jgi:hypothetical protein